MPRSCSPPVLLTLLLLAACSDDPASPARAPEPLVQLEFSGEGGGSAFLGALLFEFGLLESPVAPVGSGPAPAAPSLIVESPLVKTWVSASDEGGALRSDLGDSDRDDLVVALLTNGEDDVLNWRWQLDEGGGSYLGYRESRWLKGGLDGSWHPDLAGATLSHVLLHVDRMRFESPGSDPNGDGFWTDYEFGFRMVIFGTR